jgi:peroxiredoxin
MSDTDYKEEFIDEGDKVKYIRTMPMIPTGFCKVEMYLTKSYLQTTEKKVISNYLDHAVAEYLTRNGVHDAD